MTMLSAIMTEPDLAEVLFLVALILFAVAAFLTYQAKTLWATLISLGLVAIAFGWFAL
jgi:hypothetical protein